VDAQLDTDLLLAVTCGFAVEADDGPAGIVETPLFPPDGTEPDFLVLRIGPLNARRRIVSAALVDRVDRGARTVHVRRSRLEIERLPEHLPFAI
jgi:hypothetical protein